MQETSIDLNIPKPDFQTREAINILRGNIQMAGSEIKVVAFTSSGEHEGKSSVSFQLASSLAALEKKVLFLDCDIRNSKLKKKLNIEERTVGLSDYLCGYLTAEQLPYPTKTPYLDIVFSGAVPPNPSELLSRPRFRELVEKMRTAYDYIIVDTPPGNVVVDASLVARYCDTTVLVVEYGQTPRAEAARVKERLESYGIKILGVVINKTPKDGGRYGKYGKYGYGYGYGYGEKSSRKR